MLTHSHKYITHPLCSVVCVCVCFLNRPPGGHAWSHGQLQHHSQRAEAALQHAEGRQRHLGECEL